MVRREQAIQTAEKYVARGRIEAAIKEYRKVLADNPNDTNTLNRLGDLYARSGEAGEATRVFSQIAEHYSEDGFFVKAIAIYKKIIKLDPTQLEVYERLAELYHRQGLVNEARSQYQVLADYYLKHKNRASVINIHQKMAELEPEDPTPHVKLAELYREERLLDKAMAEYRKIAELLAQHGRPEEAVKVYRRALELNDQDIGFITDSVLTLKNAGHVGAAAQLLAYAVERNPEAERVARLAGMEGQKARGGPGKAAQPGAAAEEAPEAAPEAPAPAAAAPPEGAPAAEASGTPVPAEDSRVAPEEAPAAEAAAPPRLQAPSVPSADPLSTEIGGGAEAPAPARSEAPPELPSDTDEDSEVLILDLDDDDAPSTLVAPPADMLEEAEEVEGPGVEEGGRGFDQEVEFELDLDALDEEASLPEMKESEAAEEEIEWSFDLEPVEGLEAAAEEKSAAELAPSAAREAGPAPAAAELRPGRREEDLVAEAEVFAKYGLEEKAVDRLREVLQLNPRHLEAYDHLILLYLRQEQHERVVPMARQMVRLASEAGAPEAWVKIRDRLEGAGYGIAEDGRVVAAPQRVDPVEEGISRLLQALVEEEPRPAREEAPPPPGASSTLGEEVPVEAEELPPPAAEEPAPIADEPLPDEAEGWPELPAAAHTVLQEAESEEAESGEAEPPAPAALDESLAIEDVSLEDSGMRWLDELGAEPGEGAEGSESLFRQEEEFFDLAAELEQELTEEGEFLGEELVPDREEQSLEEIVEGFKKGVAESLSPEDYDTHFNLGIAYREMGLLDEAIGEFQLAAKDPRYLVDCCSLLGLCFVAKGLPELAIKWYRRGLESPTINEDSVLGLLYELGNTHMAAGDEEAAREAFVEIYGTNSNYRDVVAKLEELSRRH